MIFGLNNSSKRTTYRYYYLCTIDFGYSEGFQRKKKRLFQND